MRTPRDVGKEFVNGNDGPLDLNPERLFRGRGMERVDGVADARGDVQLESHWKAREIERVGKNCLD